MEGRPRHPRLVTARTENLGNLFEASRGQIDESKIRVVEVPDALVDPGEIGLLMPLRLVETLGLDPIRATWKAGPPTGLPGPIPRRAVRLAIQGRDCTVEVVAAEDHRPVVVGLVPMGAVDWVVDAEAGRLVGNPEHGGEWTDDCF